jgi:hypothetical protein
MHVSCRLFVLVTRATRTCSSIAGVTQDEDAIWFGPDHPPQVGAEIDELAGELRRVLVRALEVRPRAGELRPLIEQARALGDALEQVSNVHRPADGAVARPYDPNRFNPVSGASNAVAPPLVMWDSDGPEGPGSEGRIRFSLIHQGGPGHAHGAMVTAMYDDLLGRSQRSAGFTGWIKVTFRRPTPLHRELQLRAWVAKEDGRKRWLHGTCHLDGELLTEAEGLFIAPKQGATMEGLAAHLEG